MLPLLDIRQKDGFGCGRVMLESFHTFWERPLRPALVALSNSIQGLGPDTLDAALRASGFDVLSGSMTVPILKGLVNEGYPVACLIQFEDVGHWVMVGQISRGRVRYYCPVRGLVAEPVPQWNANWHDCHLLGGEYRRWGTCPHF